MGLGETIRKLRLKKDISITDFAKKVGVDKAYITHIEKGRALNPSLDVFMNICKALEIDMGTIEVEMKIDELTDKIFKKIFVLQYEMLTLVEKEKMLKELLAAFGDELLVKLAEEEKDHLRKL